MQILQLVMGTLLFIYLSPTFAYETRDSNNKLYLGINLGSYEDFLNDNNAMGFTFLAGYDLTDILAIESYLGYANDDVGGLTEEGSGAVEVTAYHASVYLRGNLRADEYTAYIFGGVSYLKQDIKFNINVPALGISGSADFSESFTDPSYGIGIDLYGNNTTALSIKWTRIIELSEEDGGGELDAWFFGFTHYLK